jgi:hypothetical protein
MSAVQVGGRVVMAGRSIFKSGEVAVMVIVKPRNDMPSRVHALLPTGLYGCAGAALADRVAQALREAGHARLFGSGIRPMRDTLDMQLLDPRCVSPSGAADVIVQHRDWMPAQAVEAAA